jgi:hypothetical protein
MPLLVCKKCKKEFSTKPSLIAKGGGIYCSKYCHYEDKRQGVMTECATCKKGIYRKPRLIKKSKSGNHFCDKSCQTIWRNSEFVGSKHPNWKNGNSTYRDILLRTGKTRTCGMCDNDDFRVLTVHHIDEDHGNNEVSNLAWLCFNCHHLVHHDKVEKQKFLHVRDMATMV